MRIVILTCAWKRPEIFSLFVTAVNRLRQYKPKLYKIEAVCVISEDYFRDVCTDNNIHYLHHPNKPVGAKWNAGVLYSKQFKPDAIIALGSDDIISNKVLDVYYREYKKGGEFIGFKNMYKYDVITKKMVYWKGYTHTARKGESAGAGRFIHKNILKKLKWSLWSNTLSRSLDYSFIQNLRKIKYKNVVLSVKKEKVMLCDINSPVSISGFQLYLGKEVNPEKVFKEHLPKKEYQEIFDVKVPEPEVAPPQPEVKQSIPETNGQEAVPYKVKKLPTVDNDIHPTAIFEKGAQIGSGNVIGEYAIIRSHVVIGDNNRIYNHVTVGSPGEIRKADEKIDGQVIIGDNNIIREYTTIQSSATGGETKIGNNCYIMNKCHIPHDAVLGDNVTMAVGAIIGGHVIVEDHVNMGLGAIVRQRLRIGYGAMLGMGTVITKSIKPFDTIVGVPCRILGRNDRGIKRMGISEDEVKRIIEEFNIKHESILL